MNEKYENYLKQKKLVDALDELCNVGYDIDDAVAEDILNEWANVCSDLLEFILEENRDVLERLKNGD